MWSEYFLINSSIFHLEANSLESSFKCISIAEPERFASSNPYFFAIAESTATSSMS